MLRDYEPDSDDDEEIAPYPFDEPSLPHSGGSLFQQWYVMLTSELRLNA